MSRPAVDPDREPDDLFSDDGSDVEIGGDSGGHYSIMRRPHDRPCAFPQSTLAASLPAES